MTYTRVVGAVDTDLDATIKALQEAEKEREKSRKNYILIGCIIVGAYLYDQSKKRR